MLSVTQTIKLSIRINENLDNLFKMHLFSTLTVLEFVLKIMCVSFLKTHFLNLLFIKHRQPAVSSKTFIRSKENMTRNKSTLLAQQSKLQSTCLTLSCRFKYPSIPCDSWWRTNSFNLPGNSVCIRSGALKLKNQYAWRCHCGTRTANRRGAKYYFTVRKRATEL